MSPHQTTPSPTGCGSLPVSGAASRPHYWWCGARLQVSVPYVDKLKRGDVELLPQGHVGAGWCVDFAGWLRHCLMTAGSEPPSEVTRALPFLNRQPWTKGSLCKAGSAAHRPGPLLPCGSWCFPGLGTMPTMALRTLGDGCCLQPVSWLTSECQPVSSPPRASSVTCPAAGACCPLLNDPRKKQRRRCKGQRQSASRVSPVHSRVRTLAPVALGHR